MADSNARTQIIVALIGLAGVLGAALIANWHPRDQSSDERAKPAEPTPRPSPAPTPALNKGFTFAGLKPTPTPTLFSSPTPVDPRAIHVYFQASDEAGKIMYYPNNAFYRLSYFSRVTNRTTLFFTGCELLPPAQRSTCGATVNWKLINPKSLGCSGVESCYVETFIPSDLFKAFSLSHLISSSGKPLDSAGNLK